MALVGINNFGDRIFNHPTHGNLYPSRRYYGQYGYPYNAYHPYAHLAGAYLNYPGLHNIYYGNASYPGLHNVYCGNAGYTGLHNVYCGNTGYPYYGSPILTNPYLGYAPNYTNINDCRSYILAQGGNNIYANACGPHIF